MGPSVRQYYRISLVVSSRRAANPTRGGGHTARCILSRGRGGFPHDNAVCRDVYKHIARVAHPDKNPVRSAYHCAVAGIVMDTMQRAYDMVGSSSSSDRDAFHLLPALDSEQFEGMVDAHRLAKTGHTPSVRSPITPAARSSATPIPADNRPLSGPHIPPLPLPGFADPLSPESRPFSATDALPGLAQATAQLGHDPDKPGIRASRTSRTTTMTMALPSSLMPHTPPRRSRRLLAHT